MSLRCRGSVETFERSSQAGASTGPVSFTGREIMLGPSLDQRFLVARCSCQSYLEAVLWIPLDIRI